MQEYDQTTNWKQLVIQEFNLRQDAENKIAALTAELRHAISEQKRAADYNKYLELKCSEYKNYYLQHDSKLNSTIQMLKSAKQLVLQRKTELEALQAEHTKIKSQLTEQLTNKTELLTAEIMRHEQTTLKLSVAIEDVKEINELYKALKSENETLKHELRCRTELLDAEIMQHGQAKVALAAALSQPASKIGLLDEEILIHEAHEDKTPVLGHIEITSESEAETEDEFIIDERASENR